MKATLEDVARLAGVHASTVSRVISGKSRIGQETRERVLAAIQRLDYHPNAAARSLAGGRAEAAGLVLDAALLALLRERTLDGLILPSVHTNRALYPLLKNFPCVFISKTDFSLGAPFWVDNDQAAGSQMAVEHLLARGYTAVSYLGADFTPADPDFVMRRLEGYRAALPLRLPPRIFPTDGTPRAARQIAAACLGDLELPHGFVCNDCLTAIGLLQAVRDAGLRVPQDVGVLCFNNEPAAEFLDPAVTVIQQDALLMGKTAAQLLLDQIDDPHMPPKQILLSPQLIPRASTMLEA